MVLAGKCSFLRVPFILGGKFCSGEEKHFVLWIPQLFGFFEKAHLSGKWDAFQFQGAWFLCVQHCWVGAVSCWN